MMTHEMEENHVCFDDPLMEKAYKKCKAMKETFYNYKDPEIKVEWIHEAVQELPDTEMVTLDRLSSLEVMPKVTNDKDYEHNPSSVDAEKEVFPILNTPRNDQSTVAELKIMREKFELQAKELAQKNRVIQKLESEVQSLDTRMEKYQHLYTQEQQKVQHTVRKLHRFYNQKKRLRK